MTLARVHDQPVAWSAGGGELPRLDQLPIPVDVVPGPGWTAQMREIADHIGAYATLRIIAAFGGRQVYVSRDPAASPFREVIAGEEASILADVFGGNRLLVPVGRVPLARARRAVVIAAVRARRVTGADAARILGTSRTYLSHLVNETDEGREIGATERAKALPAQLDLFSGALPAPE